MVASFSPGEEIPMNRHWQSGLAFVLLLPLAGAAQESGYARPELLIEPSELADRLEGDQVAILDARSRQDYDAGHVAGARWVDHQQWREAFQDGQDGESWSERIGGMGIGADSTVVIYDDQGMRNAARIWWILRYWGVTDARLLNGGWKAWQAMDGPVTDQAAEITPVEFEARPFEQRLTTKDQILGQLGSGRLQIVDTRSEGEYCGTDPRRNRRGGAIPGAIHLEWSQLIDSETGRFRPADELRTLFERAGIELDRPAVTHCQSGGRASVMAFGLELMGADAVSNYYRGWSEWGNTPETPVEQHLPEPDEE
jgi:thiosulfate/3-mercaptopyruvate sulfurtransferase